MELESEAERIQLCRFPPLGPEEVGAMEGCSHGAVARAIAVIAGRPPQSLEASGSRLGVECGRYRIPSG